MVALKSQQPFVLWGVCHHLEYLRWKTYMCALAIFMETFVYVVIETFDLQSPAPPVIVSPQNATPAILSLTHIRSFVYAKKTSLAGGHCKGNSQIPIFWLCNSCNTLQFLRLCAIICLKSRTKSQHPLITQYMLHIVYPYHIIPLSISVPCYHC